jgi:hypothetical protein
VIKWTNQITTFPAREFLKQDQGTEGTGVRSPHTEEIGGSNRRSRHAGVQAARVGQSRRRRLRPSAHRKRLHLARRSQRLRASRAVEGRAFVFRQSEEQRHVRGDLGQRDRRQSGLDRVTQRHHLRTLGRTTIPWCWLPSRWRKTDTTSWPGGWERARAKSRSNFSSTSRQPVATKPFPVNPAANSSKLAIGQERDATNHPGKESFDGELARFLIYDRPADATTSWSRRWSR